MYLSADPEKPASAALFSREAFSGSIRSHVLGYDRVNIMNDPRSKFDLTRRELEVLVKMSEGYTQKEIADLLFVSPNTVNSHAQHIYEKMEVHTGMHAIAKAFRADLIK